MTIARGRLDLHFAELLRTHETVAVFAAAGSGKTVQAQLCAADQGWPLAWLTVDQGDRSPSRLLFYLAEALRSVRPGTPSVAETPDLRISIDEVAAMLAEGVPDEPLLLVVDDAEHLVGAEESLEALGVFLDYLPPSIRTVILGREDLDGPIGRMMLQGRIARVGGSDLALEIDETTELLAAHGQGTHDPASLTATTNGWIAAVAFDVVPGLNPHGGPDALAAYLNREVLARLPEAEQDFLLRTSVLASVSARSAVELCGDQGYALWKSLAARHLPATQVDRSLVYHPRFRQFLREELHARMPDELPDLLRRRAGLLVDGHLYEEAVEVYLQADEPDAAADAADHAVTGLCTRADWPTLLRWFEALGPERIRSRPSLQGAQIRVLYGVRRIPEAQALIRRLHEQGALTAVAEADPGVVAFFGYALQWHPADALELMGNYRGDYRSVAVRYELEAVAGRTPVPPPAGIAWTDSERIFSWGLLVQGRLGQLLRLLPAEEDWPPRSFYRTPHPLLALIWQGRLDRARELLDEVPEAVRSGSHTDLWFFHEAWLLWAEGRPKEALDAAEAAVEHSRRTQFGWEPCFGVVVGRLQLALGAIDDARMTLADAISNSAASGNRAYVEWGQTFQGLAFLLADMPTDAVRVLRSATRGMQAAGRDLMLPVAAAYLAEAEARCGDPEAARAAAALAFETAEGMDSLFVLRQALADVPDVLRRQIERHPTDERWRGLVGRPASERRDPAPTRVSSRPMIVEVRTHGPNPDLVVDGSPRGSRRTKVLELAAYLALHPEGVERNRLQERLFPDGDPRRGGNYFRQVVHKLRQATGVSLTRSAQGLVRWPDEVHVDCTDLRFERLTAEAAELEGEERLSRLEATLALVEGVYLPDSDLEWAEQRRHELEVLIVEAALEAARLAFRLGHTQRARAAATFAIDRDPFCEAAYCVRMQVEAQLGSSHAVLAEYHRLTEALSELGVAPAPSTRELMQTLRG
ncbi:hypothetical protein GCM10009836_50670 [Pseudonocardia ailaonensis]|uniref:Bacterial transcriptional activator domain-containing protein n=1 Tax=Pseudonocardia ailaonensis TaxID=367279 RepID=A0ABN2NGN2_9PSEU